MKFPDRISILCRIILALVGLMYIIIPGKLAAVEPLHYGIVLIVLAIPVENDRWH